MKKHNKKLIFLLAVLPMLLVSCNTNVAFNEYRQVPASGWDMDSTIVFVYNAKDTAGFYDLVIDVRHNNDYPYQNMWLFIDSESPEGYSRSDTLEFYLADNMGRWLSEKSFSYYEMPVLYMQKVRFPSVGDYRFKVIQGLRDSVLCGVESVGLTIKKSADGEK